jgi:hypothetical protein
MGLLMFVWGIYTELQNCNVSNGPWPLPFPITELVSKARKNGFICLPSSTTPVMEMLEDYIIRMNQKQKMFVTHYYINNQMLDTCSYLHTKSEKIWLLFTFVLN